MHRLTLLLGGALVLGSTSAVSANENTLLSAAQEEVIAQNIEQLQSQADRDVALSWSDAKKVAEFICRPLALDDLQKWNAEANRVFLGTDDPSTLNLESGRMLSGSGEVRTGDGWASFEFSCELNPDTGEALSFETDLPQN